MPGKQVVCPGGVWQVRLEGAADRPAGEFSGGMRRRLSVAAALLGDPKVG
jgi:ABC-type multidrug transport system ATPase subunit